MKGKLFTFYTTRFQFFKQIPLWVIALGLLVGTSTFAQSIENLGSAINTEYSELNPVIAPDGKILYFGRKNHPQNKFGAEGTEQIAGSQDIWFSEFTGAAWSTARRMSDVLNRDQYNTIYSISPDGNTLLLKGAYVNGQYETRGFSISKKTASGWSVPQKMVIPKFERMNVGKNDFGFLSNDGKVLLMSFSQNKSAKKDEGDLYVSFQDDEGEWTQPMSLGPDVNTFSNETTPFLAADGKTLYFSSDREGGLGSYDVYVCKRLDDTWENWTQPANLGDKVNTEGFEAYYTVSAVGDYAYFVSEKGSLGKKDVVRLKLNTATPVAVTPTIAKNDNKNGGDNNNEAKGTKTTKDKKDQVATIDTRSEPVVMLSGKVSDSKTGRTPPNAKIIYEDLNTGKQLGVATPDPISGQYKIVLPYGKKYGITVQMDGYLPVSQNIDLSTNTNNKFLEITDRDIAVIPLNTGDKEDIKVKLNNIFFQFGKSNLQNESFPELNRMVQFMTRNAQVKVEIGGHTDNVGSDEVNNKLSQERAESVRTYLVSKGIKVERIGAKGYGKTQPVATNLTEEGQQANRRVEFKILRN